MLFVVFPLLAIFLFGMPIVVFFVFQSSKKVQTAFLVLPVTAIVGIIGWQVAEANHYFIASTDLSSESVAGLSLLQTVNEAQLKEIGRYEKSDQVDGFGYTFDELYITTDTDHRIQSISTSIHTGDPIEKRISSYGEHYYTYSEMGLGKAYVYVDRCAEQKMTVWTNDELVRFVWLSAE